MIHLRSLHSNKQAGPLCKRPGYKEATRALMSLQYAEGQGAPKIPLKIKDSSKPHTGSWTPKNLRMAKFSLGGALCETAKFRTPTTIIIIVIFKLVTKPIILGQSMASHGWQDKEWWDNGKNDNDRFTLRIALGSCWRARRSRWLSKST